ncbi:heterokaryon incompatibility protein-domain-containing protein, partial [Podospora aff. communis PSN243]
MDAPRLPTRVIDVDPSLPNPRLVTKHEERDDWEPYTALSYCWGKSQATMTMPDNLSRHTTDGFQFSALPRAIQDAITVARGLSIRYLWVDALCILQGSSPEATADWLAESSMMSDIYGGATLVIIAGDSQDCNMPFLYQRELVTTSRPSRDGVLDREIPSAHRTTVPKGYVDLKANTWPTRAWTLQESALSRRALIYTKDQVYWRCAFGLVGYDAYLHVLPRIDSLPPVVHERDYWPSVVTEYSTRFMTNPADKLPALAGLARLHCESNDVTYAAGLCLDTFHSGLLWRTEYSEKRHPSRPSHWRAPSWSWVSIDGPVDY